MMTIEQLEQVGLDMMDRVKDPFHDLTHAHEVYATMQKIIKEEKLVLSEEDKAVVKLTAYFHDVSRVIIGANPIMQPLVDGPFSTLLFWNAARRAKIDRSIVRRVIKMILKNEEVLGTFHWKRNKLQQVFFDADTVEMFNPDRFNRGLGRFKRKKYPKWILSFYCYAFPKYILKPVMGTQFLTSQKIFEEYNAEFIDLIRDELPYLKQNVKPSVYENLLLLLEKKR